MCTGDEGTEQGFALFILVSFYILFFPHTRSGFVSTDLTNWREFYFTYPLRTKYEEPHVGRQVTSFLCKRGIMFHISKYLETLEHFVKHENVVFNGEQEE